MPFINANGHIIEELTDNASTAKAAELSRINWPTCERYLWHTTWADFRMWIYLMNPREAMILSNDPEFVAFREAKRRKSWLEHFESWIWRKLWA